VGNQASFYHLLFAYTSVTPGLNFTIRSAAFITAGFWGVLGSARLLCIYLAHSFSPEQMLLVDAMAAVASLSLLASAPTSGPTLWASTAVYSFSFAGMLPASVSLADRACTLSQTKYAMACLMTVSGALGEMVLPVLLASFFQEPETQTCKVIYLQLFILALSLAVLLAEYVRAIQRSNAVGDEEALGLVAEAPVEGEGRAMDEAGPVRSPLHGGPGVLAIPSSASKLHNIINVDLKHDDRFNDRPDDFCGRLSGDSVGSGTLSHDVFWESDD